MLPPGIKNHLDLVRDIKPLAAPDTVIFHFGSRKCQISHKKSWSTKHVFAFDQVQPFYLYTLSSCHIKLTTRLISHQ